MDVADPRAGLVEQQLVTDRVDQVGLAEADAAVQEQRVVRDAGVVRTWIAAARASWFALPVTKLSNVSTGFSFERSYIESASPPAAGAAPGLGAACGGRRPLRARAGSAGRCRRRRRSGGARRLPTASSARRPVRWAQRRHSRWLAAIAATVAAGRSVPAARAGGRCRTGGGAAAAFGSRTNWTSIGALQNSRARSEMRPENRLLTQSSLKRFGAAMDSVFADASKATGAKGLIHVTYCWGVSSRSSSAEQCCQKSFIK